MTPSAMKRLKALLALVAREGTREVLITTAGAREVLKQLK